MINSLRLEVLRAKRATTPAAHVAEFSGFYNIAEDSRENDKDHIHSVNRDILAATQIRFTCVFAHFMTIRVCSFLCRVDEHDNKRVSGLATTFYCSQDAHRKQKARKIDNTEKQRDTLGMDRFLCKSRLHISVTHHPSGVQEIAVRFRHEDQHVPYTDVTMPQLAMDFIRNHVAIAKPGDLLPTMQGLDGCKHVSGAQVHRVWRELSEVLWKRNANAVRSACKLLEEYATDGRAVQLDIAVPDGVTALAWTLPKITRRVAANIKEVAIDATCELLRMREFDLAC
jgi:hypothetical protein